MAFHFTSKIFIGVVVGQRRRPRDGRDISVRAIRQRAGSAGAQRPLAALLPQRDLLPLARPHRGPGRNQPDLPTGNNFELKRGNLASIKSAVYMLEFTSLGI